MEQNKTTQRSIGLIAISLFLLLIAIGYGYWLNLSQIDRLTEQVAHLNTELDETKTALQGSIRDTQLSFIEALDEERLVIDSVKRELGGVEETVGSITGSVSTLEKLTQTDQRLLQKYSRVFFLNEHYHPARLVEIPDRYNLNSNRSLRFHTQAWPYLEELLEAAWRNNLELYVVSGFRSFNEQTNIKDNYVTTYGAGTANQFSADQGYSEHQLGTAIDFSTASLGGGLTGFQNTEAYYWLKNNAHRYGFILSYPEGNEHYIYEPWHWRFVGVKLATDLHQAEDYFYDWEQHEIDEYLIYLFD